MTVAATTVRSTALTDGSTGPYSFGFLIYAESDLVVYREGALLTLDVDYTVSGGPWPTGGTITLTVAGDSDETLAMYSAIPQTQEVDYATSDSFPSASHENSLDKLTRLVHQMQDQVHHALRSSLSETPGATNMQLPTPASRRGKLLAFADTAAAYPEAAAALDVEIESLTQSLIGGLLHPQTPAESAAGVTPVDFTVSSHLADGIVRVDRYGNNATPGTTDMAAAITAAIAVANQAGVTPIYFGTAVYAVASSIAVSTNGLTFKGPSFQRLRSGSTSVGATLRWIGGASSLFDLSTGFTRFYDLNIENRGTGDFAFDNAENGRFLLERVTALKGTSDTHWSGSFVRFLGPSPYIAIRYCEIRNPSEVFILYDGNNEGNGITTFDIEKNIFTGPTDGSNDVVVYKMTGDAGGDILRIRDNTFNSYMTAKLIGLDMSGVDGTVPLDVLLCEGNEFDFSGTGNAGSRAALLAHCNNARFIGNHLNGSGAEDCAVELTNGSNAHFESNWDESLGVMCIQGAGCRATFGPHEVSGGQHLVDDDGAGMVIPVTFPGAGGEVRLEGDLAPPDRLTVFELEITDTDSFSIAIDLRTSGGNFFTRGQLITVIVKNSSGGAMGTITWTTSRFNLAGSFTNPADGNFRTITFMCHSPTELVEIGRSVADCANGA